MTDVREPFWSALRVLNNGVIPTALFNEIESVLNRHNVPRSAPQKPVEAQSAPKALRDPEAFYRAVRAVSGPLEQVQVDTVQGLLAKAAHWPPSWLAYGFGTAWHEARLKPIEEIGKGRGRRYGIAGARSDGKPGPSYSGQIPYGRGLVQLTWADNYEKADRELGLNGALLADFSLALRPDIAAAILVHGMEKGWFTGRKLADCFANFTGD